MRGNLTVCTRCSRNARVSAWKRANPERTRQHSGYGGTEQAKRRWKATPEGQESGRRASVRSYWRHHSKVRARCRARYVADPDRAIQKVVDRNKRIVTPKWANLDAIAAIYAEARRMTTESGVQFQVDHFIPIRHPLVCGLHVEDNLNILTASENRSKGNRLMLER